MSFDAFMTDNIIVRKQNGDLLEGLKASVQRDNIFLDRSDVLIEPRDLIERRTSNGAIETFEVIDPGFNEAFHGIEAHYQMSVRKLGIPEAKQRIESITYNINGHNTHINNNSIDRSTNIINIGTELHEYIEGLRREIQALTNAQQKQDALEIFNAVEAQIASPKPSKSVISTLLKALPDLASITTLASAIISAI